jgi:DNA-binding IclR family transcriptional regulator
VEKAITILDHLAAQSDAATATEIHSVLRLPKATTFMILNVLERHGMVKKSRDGRYTIGLKLYQLGTTYIAKLDIVQVARPHLVTLVRKTALTAHLGAAHEGSMMFIDKVEPDSFIRFSTFPGMRSELHVSSLGKAIAAHLPDDERGALVGHVRLPVHTPRTLSTVEALVQELAGIRRRGYAVEDEEGELGVRCVGAPIFNRENRVVAAVSVTGIVGQIPTATYKTLGARVRIAADAISRELGFAGTTRIVAPPRVVPQSGPASAETKDWTGKLAQRRAVAAHE